MSLRWAEISTEPDRARFEALSAALAAAGLDNQVEFIKADAGSFPEALREAQASFAQLRIGGGLRARVPEIIENFPSTLLSLRMADAFARAAGAERPWWPRCYLDEGFRRSLISDVRTFDLSGAVFILGATLEARAAIAALARLGYSRFSIADADDGKCEAFVAEVAKGFFNLRLQFVHRGQITQLPNIHTVAINTLAVGRDDGTHGELFYFNFLKAGGVWLDLSLRPANADLALEAKSVGAIIARGAGVAAWTDLAWAADVLKVALEGASLRDAYLEASRETRD